MKNKLWALILYPLSFFMSADWLDINMPVGVTDISREVFGLHMTIFFVVVAIGVVVFGVLFWSMWKYRRSNNKKPATFTENHTVEILWTIVYSVGSSDNYESNLIRRVCGLLYVSDKDSGDIKLKVKSTK